MGIRMIGFDLYCTFKTSLRGGKVAGGLMGLSVKCARCHDHKFDAIPQRDYYRLMASLITSYNPADWRPVFRFDKTVNERSLIDVTETTRKQIDADNGKINGEIGAGNSRIKSVRQAARTRVLEKKRAAVPKAIRADVITAIGTDQLSYSAARQRKTTSNDRP